MSQDEPSPEPTPETGAQPERDGVTRSELFRALHEAIGGDSIDAARVRRMIAALLDERDELRAEVEGACELLGPGGDDTLKGRIEDVLGDLCEARAEVERLRAERDAAIEAKRLIVQAGAKDAIQINRNFNAVEAERDAERARAERAEKLLAEVDSVWAHMFDSGPDGRACAAVIERSKARHAERSKTDE